MVSRRWESSAWANPPADRATAAPSRPRESMPVSLLEILPNRQLHGLIRIHLGQPTHPLDFFYRITESRHIARPPARAAGVAYFRSWCCRANDGLGNEPHRATA